MTQTDVARAMSTRGVDTRSQTISGWENALYAPATRDAAAALDAVLEADGSLLALLGYGTDAIDDQFAAINARLERIEAVLEKVLDQPLTGSGEVS